MKVLQVVPELNAGGVERTTLEIAEALHLAGQVPHICSNGGRLLPDFEPYSAVHHIFNVGSKNPLWLRRHTQKLVDIIKTEAIDIVHARSRAPAWPAYAAAKATGRPFVTTYHGIYNARLSVKKRYNAIMTRGDLIIANSNYTKDHIIAEHDIDEALIRVIPRGVDMALFNPKSISKKAVQDQRAAWKIGAQDIAVLLPGRLTSWKGQMIAIKALAGLPASYKLILMGDAQGRDDYVSELWELAQQIDMEDRLIVPGHTDDVAAALASADMIIAPSTDPEAFGRVVTEAQAMKRPVIASNHGGPVETILPGRTGYLVEPSNAQALAETIIKTAGWDDYDGAKARQHVAKNFSKAQLQAKTLAVYSELMV